MKKQEIKVGDYVVLKKGLEVGKTYGGIALFDKMKDAISKPRKVKLVDNFGGFIVDDDGYFFYFTPEMVEVVSVFPTITEHLIRGNKTIVKLSNGNVGIAKCPPEDKFDEYEGLRIATARAYGREVEYAEEPKKEKPKFKLWDRVCHKRFGAGTIVNSLYGDMLVVFDKENEELHDAGNFGYNEKYPDHRCWFCIEANLKKI